MTDTINSAATHCSDCAAPLKPNPRRKTTWCRPCLARRLSADPVKLAKCRAAMKARFTDPAYRAAHGEHCKNGWAKAMQKPEFVAQRRAMGRKVGLLHMGFNTLPPRHPARLAAARKASNARLAWCPVEYRDEYRTLRRTKLLSATEARRMIEAQIASDLERYRKTGQLQQAGRAAHDARDGAL